MAEQKAKTKSSGCGRLIVSQLSRCGLWGRGEDSDEKVEVRSED